MYHHHLPLLGGDEGTLQTQGKWLACLAGSASPVPPKGPGPTPGPLLRPQNLCRADAGPWPTLCWELLQALGITACFQHLYLKPSSVACPWGCFLTRLLPVCCKGAGLLHQLLLSKCWPWGPLLVFCLALAIFTCSPGPQLSLQPPTHHSWLILSQGPLQLWARWGPSVAKRWGPRTLGRAH